MKQPIRETNARFLLSRCAKKMTACVLSAALLLACCPLALAAERDADPLTAQELARMTDEEIAALSQEQSDATLNKMAQLFQDGEKQALDEYLSALGFATTYEEYAEQQGWDEEEDDDAPSIQPMWQSDYGSDSTDKQCHEGLTTAGFLVYLAARNELFNGGSIGFQLSDLAALSRGSAWPDWDLEHNDYLLYLGHFYDPDTGENYAHQTNNTAKTRAETYYSLAVSSYRKGGAGNRTDAIAYLSYCLHYVQDVGVPHHAANKTALSSNHSAFEELATEVFYKYLDVDLHDTEKYTLSFYNNCYTSSLGQFVHDAAKESKQYISIATDEDNIFGQELVAAVCLANTIQNTSAVLYKFAKEVGMI